MNSTQVEKVENAQKDETIEKGEADSASLTGPAANLSRHLVSSTAGPTAASKFELTTGL